MFEKILVPLDGSKIAEQVFPWVKELALAFNAEIVTLGVCEPHEKEHEATCQIYVGNQAQQLKEIVAKYTMAEVKSAVLVGKPAEEIIAHAENNNFKLVIMASSGRSGIKPWALGSTVDKFTREVRIPLLVIRATEKPLDQGNIGIFSQVLVPLDGSEASETALPYITELVARLKSEITLIQVLASGKHVHTIGGLDFVPYTDYDIDSRKAKALDYLKKVSSGFGSTQTVKKFEVRVGDPADEIIKYADKTNSQLIALTTHGQSGIERWVLGSVAYKILHSSKKSVLLIPQLGEKSEHQ